MNDPLTILMITLAAFAVGLVVATINARNDNDHES